MDRKQRLMMAVSIGCASLAACAPTADADFVQPDNQQVSYRDARQCAPVVERQLDALGLSAQAGTIGYFEELRNRDRGGDRPEALRGFNAWVDLRDCPGYLVIDMWTNCRITQIYTTGSCSLPSTTSG